MNKVILMGRLTRDPEIRYSQNENSSAIARFTIAVDRRFKRQGDEQTADFINCVAFGKTAEFVENYLKQGTKVVGCGRIQTGSYTNKEGQRVYTTDVVIEELEFAESKKSAQQYDTGREAQKPEPSEDGFVNIPDGLEDGLPFSQGGA